MPPIKNYHSIEDFAADESFQEYCLGTSKASKTKWDRYKKKFPEKSPLMEEAEAFILMLSPSKPSTLADDKSHSLFLSNWMKGVVSMVIVLTLGIIIFSISKKDEQYQIESRTAEGNEMSMLLSDLSKIDLRRKSSLKFKQSWQDSDLREVWLNGEAFFEVEKSKENHKAFVVHLPQGQVEVIGTKFLVKCDSINTKILLEEGRINFSVGNKLYDLEPGDELNYNLQGISIIHDVDIRVYDSWRSGQLSFQDEELGKILEIFEHSYGLNVVLGNSNLRNRKISAIVYQNDPHLLLEAIAEIYEIEMIKDADQIILK